MAEESLKLFLREIRLGDITNKMSLGDKNFVPLKTFLEVYWAIQEKRIEMATDESLVTMQLVIIKGVHIVPPFQVIEFHWRKSIDSVNV